MKIVEPAQGRAATPAPLSTAESAGIEKRATRPDSISSAASAACGSAASERVTRVPAPRERMFAAIAAELDRAYEKHGTEPWSRHEFYAILKEEVDELWDDIKADAPQDRVLAELIQVAAMCVRYYETGDRHRSGATDKDRS